MTAALMFGRARWRAFRRRRRLRWSASTGRQVHEHRCGAQRGYVVIVFGPDLRVPMRNYLIRSLEAAVCIACLAAASGVMSADSAVAQGQATSPAVKQIALTKTHIERVIAAQKEMDVIYEKVSEKPRTYLIVAEQFESAAK